jgi:ApaG protein
MLTSITEGIKISVENQYISKMSNPMQGKFIFSYVITIENLSNYSVQLLRRHWFITDSNINKYEVEGEGVIGQQPILQPGEFHRYESGCHLQSDIGKMLGYYIFKRMSDNQEFKVLIPAFVLIADYRLN